MRVFYTDESFELNGVPLPGIPFLANAGAELIESANRYLFHIAVVRGRTRSPATWRTYADHLYEFFSFLEENALFWTRVNQEHIAVWRNSMRMCSHASRCSIKALSRSYSLKMFPILSG
ncbi:hypothetical protein Z046_32240 [Pseudomonas aeruginosa VRFPA09]|nr:hypothetical protein Z046_32240 [Pseudomonas aeruginosa VRFPA09]